MKYHYIISTGEEHWFEHHTKMGMEQDCTILDRYKVKYMVKTIENKP